MNKAMLLRQSDEALLRRIDKALDQYPEDHTEYKKLMRQREFVIDRMKKNAQ